MDGKFYSFVYGKDLPKKQSLLSNISSLTNPNALKEQALTSFNNDAKIMVNAASRAAASKTGGLGPGALAGALGSAATGAARAAGALGSVGAAAGALGSAASGAAGALGSAASGAPNLQNLPGGQNQPSAGPFMGNEEKIEWKFYYPIIHIFAGVVYYDKIIFGIFYAISRYLISPNLHPLIYYYIFYLIMFDIVKKNYDYFATATNDFIKYFFSLFTDKQETMPIPDSIKGLVYLFMVFSFLGNIGAGFKQFSVESIWISIIKAILFFVVFGMIMAYINTSCILAILYIIVYTLFGMLMFSKVGIFKTMYGIDLYFFKKIQELANPKDVVLNFIVNNLFLFIFEIIAIFYLLRGMNDYITKLEAVELKIALCLTNAILIYLIVKYGHYKFQTLLPKYKKDVKDYDNIINSILMITFQFMIMQKTKPVLIKQ